jgi:hypothetical protein
VKAFCRFFILIVSVRRKNHLVEKLKNAETNFIDHRFNNLRRTDFRAAVASDRHDLDDGEENARRENLFV